MPTNRITGNAKDGIVVLRVARDKEYDLVQIAERFEVPYAEPNELSAPSQQRAYYAMVEGMGYSVAKHAIERYEKLRHWRFESSRSVVLDKSMIQYNLDEFRKSNMDDILPATPGSIIDTLGKVAYVVKLWFRMPKIEVEVIQPEPDDPETSDGFVNPHKMLPYVTLGKS